MNRRRFIQGAVAASLLGGRSTASWAGPLPKPFDARVGAGRGARELAVRAEAISIAGGTGSAVTINGSVPGPLIELREGEDAVLRVTNEMAVDTSIHWHGILLPFEMDGVPGVVFPGVAPGESFEARFPVRQNGTYWYHSHSGLQEQSGAYGPLVIHPAKDDDLHIDRDYVVLLSDWTFEDPRTVADKLKKLSHYYNTSSQTLGDFLKDAATSGLAAAWKDRAAWSAMRMDPTDIADVTGATYTYLMNGVHPDGNWTGAFRPGERVRLRFINAAAMTFFNVRIPGLPMTVVAADGPRVEPVETDEFQIGVAETFDVVVEPTEDRAYTVFAESMDRSGFARGTLSPGAAHTEAAVPELREPPVRTMADMGHAMAPGHHASHGSMEADHYEGHRSMDGHHPMVDMGVPHGPDRHGFGNIGVAEFSRDRLGEPGIGLAGLPHRVLVYRDLRALEPPLPERPVDRELELHLTGNMERYMWSFDGKKFSEVDGPIRWNYGERVRLILVNDTMMEHPIHLHGMFMQLENGHGPKAPFKHTVSVKPAERMALQIDAVEPGPWAFHCHLLYHMEMGMFRVIEVGNPPRDAS